VRVRGADPDAEARPAGEKNRGEGIGRWMEEERGGADMWGQAASKRNEGASVRAGENLGQRGPRGGEKWRGRSAGLGEELGRGKEKERRRGPRVREERGFGPAGLGSFLFLLSFFFSFFFSILN
jgi:hypothetical protein